MTDHCATTRAWLAGWILAAIFMAAAVPTILWGPTPQRINTDQNDYHLKAILEFAHQWPRPDFSDYKSATTPGYHLVMAAASAVVGESEKPLRLAGMVFTAELLVLLGWACARASGSLLMGLACAAPFLASPYVFASGAWLLPDNAAWLGVLGVVLLCMSPRLDAWSFVGAAVVLALLVFTRQIHLWALAPMLAAAWVGQAKPGTSSPGLLSADEIRLLTSTPGLRVRRALVALVAGAPAIWMLVGFVRLWGGLVPPQFQTVLHGGNPAAPAFVLSLLAIYAAFLGAWFWPGAMALLRDRAWVPALAGLGGVAVALVPATTFDIGAGRWSGLWQVVDRAPVIAGHTSVVLLILAPAGAIAAVVMASMLPTRTRWVFLACLAGFVAAQSANHECWQRYIEPLLLMLVALVAAHTSPIHGAPGRRLRLAGPAALALILAGLTGALVLRG